MKGALRLIYPPQCMSCDAPVAEEGALCPTCWNEVEFLGNCCCSRCGVPLPDDGGGDHAGLLCDDCLALPRPWQRGRGALAYRGTGRKLVLMLKHGDRLDLAPALGDWAARAAAPLVRQGMAVVPVPLHPRRLARRKYNQAALLSQRVARVHGLAHLPRALVRLRHTPMQDHGSADDRFANLAGALAVRSGQAAALQGRAVLLVDDVMASGATLAAATEALLRAGSGPVSVVVLARAIKDT
ncbi:MAG: ComF family protein [Paracoccus sp. (in: a-proteobacteria)]|uniref:double zinc ribbon domain-containing protein n=1 Tax=Paracoccus sp. TaxID=267 RepID=UPI0039E63BE1